MVGDRPAGTQPNDNVMTQVGVRAGQAMGIKDFFIGASSTDSNTPIALGIPAVTLGGGGIGGGSHAPQEWFSPLNARRGPQNTLLAILALAGVDGVSERCCRSVFVSRRLLIDPCRHRLTLSVLAVLAAAGVQPV